VVSLVAGGRANGGNEFANSHRREEQRVGSMRRVCTLAPLTTVRRDQSDPICQMSRDSVAVVGQDGRRKINAAGSAPYLGRSDTLLSRSGRIRQMRRQTILICLMTAFTANSTMKGMSSIGIAHVNHTTLDIFIIPRPRMWWVKHAIPRISRPDKWHTNAHSSAASDGDLSACGSACRTQGADRGVCCRCRRRVSSGRVLIAERSSQRCQRWRRGITNT
jgi:hypothetical protein